MLITADIRQTLDSLGVCLFIGIEVLYVCAILVGLHCPTVASLRAFNLGSVLFRVSLDGSACDGRFRGK